MVDKVSTAISSVFSEAGVKEDNDVQLLFTGHSAGGAVASLLYAHMSSKNPSALSQLGSSSYTITITE
jgi:putative lipase involved disintegration of autophagic bodies